MTIALIDDDHDDQFLFSAALSRIVPAAEFLYFDSGRIAIREICDNKTVRPDLIFLDINMPGVDGFEVAEHLNRIYDPMPVIVFSTTISDAHRERFLKLRVQHFEEKPSDFKGLMKVIEKYA